MKTASAKRTSYFSYPAEIVWRSIAAEEGKGPSMDPLAEEDFDSKEPADGTIFTRVLEMRQNELFSIRMKAAGFITDLTIELFPIEECETKVVFTNTTTYRTTAAWVFSRFGMNLRKDLGDLARVMLTRIEDSMPKTKKKFF